MNIIKEFAYECLDSIARRICWLTEPGSKNGQRYATTAGIQGTGARIGADPREASGNLMLDQTSSSRTPNAIIIMNRGFRSPMCTSDSCSDSFLPFRPCAASHGVVFFVQALAMSLSALSSFFLTGFDESL